MLCPRTYHLFDLSCIVISLMCRTCPYGRVEETLMGQEIHILRQERPIEMYALLIIKKAGESSVEPIERIGDEGLFAHC